MLQCILKNDTKTDMPVSSYLLVLGFIKIPSFRRHRANFLGKSVLHYSVRFQTGKLREINNIFIRIYCIYYSCSITYTKVHGHIWLNNELLDKLKHH